VGTIHLKCTSAGFFHPSAPPEWSVVKNPQLGNRDQRNKAWSLCNSLYGHQVHWEEDI
jgi:hypothetical protein